MLLTYFSEMSEASLENISMFLSDRFISIQWIIFQNYPPKYLDTFSTKIIFSLPKKKVIYFKKIILGHLKSLLEDKWL